MTDATDAELVAGLRRAIDGGEIAPWFQPVMDPAGVTMLSAEALPRWDDPIKGVIPAGVFIGCAIRHGLLTEISRILLGRSCENYADWRAREIAPPVVSVNFTGAELRSGDAVDQVTWALERASMDPRQLAIEIAERVLYEDGWEANLAEARRLVDLGVPFWLDDFGADKGDPDTLAKLPFALAKVDRGIVGALDTDPAMVDRLGALVGAARGHGMAIIAKGVETREQIDILMGTGCDGQQGYAIARPMPEDSFAEWLDLNSWPGSAVAAG
ncbi:MAG: EAL domain-containing protein [Paracoccaceae bacterium]